MIRSYIQSSINAMNAFEQDAQLHQRIKDVSDLMIATLKAGNKVITCGNGGSMCQAMHLAEELTARYRKDRKPLAAIALADSSHITCSGNDFGFDEIFSRSILALGRENDLFIGFSTSGNSKNVINANQCAVELGMKTVAITGKTGGELANKTDFLLNVPESDTPHVQEMHTVILHLFCEAVDSAF